MAKASSPRFTDEYELLRPQKETRITVAVSYWGKIMDRIRQLGTTNPRLENLAWASIGIGASAFCSFLAVVFSNHYTRTLPNGSQEVVIWSFFQVGIFLILSLAGCGYGAIALYYGNLKSKQDKEFAEWIANDMQDYLDKHEQPEPKDGQAEQHSGPIGTPAKSAPPN